MRDPQNPVWDERFTFDIVNGQEELQVFVANKDVYGSNDILGQCFINFQGLRDQMKHEEWFELKYPQTNSRSSNEIMGNIHLVLQWIYCKEKYFESALRRLEESLKEETLQK
jgi:Ca2+-dependent lipid-binding protein